MEKFYDDLPVAIDCHPTDRLIGLGFMDGTVLISSYQIDGIKKRKQHQLSIDQKLTLFDHHRRQHKRAIRRVNFSPMSGDRLFVITKNRALCQWDVESGKKVRCIRECHDVPPFALHCISDDRTATGDEVGAVKLWDWRVGNGSPCVMTFREDVHVDIINDLTSSSDNRILLSVSGDGTLSAFNIKKRAFEMQSEEMHAELLSVAITKNGERVICGSGEGGYVEIFKWNEFGNISERMQTSHQDSVDRLKSIGQSGLVASASSLDGYIRLLRFDQNADLGIIGQHEEDGSAAGVEDMAVTYDEKYLISCGQDQKVRVWDLEQAKNRLRAQKVDSEDEDERKSPKKVKKKKVNNFIDADFFNDLKSNENGNESDSDESE